MKKLASFIIATIIAITILNSAAALAECSEGGGGGGGNVQQNGVINQAVNGNGNVQQVVYNNYHTTIVHNVVAPSPTPTPTPNYQQLTEHTAVYGSAFVRMMVSQLEMTGWTVIWQEEASTTNSYVVALSAYRGAVVITGYKVIYSRLSRWSDYHVALTTAYHPGWKVSDYPGSEIILQKMSEQDAITMIVSWFSVQYAELTSSAAVTVTAANATGCGCCRNCSCSGNCHPGCGCGCAADIVDSTALPPTMAGK